jgi:UDP-N-acetylmuramate: L-alanyl-gamma-D-glutamyl-meso-diaminopimelate ligase
VAIVEPRSNTMRLGTHNDTLAQSFSNADLAIIYQPANLNWDLSQLCQQADNIVICNSLDDIIARLKQEAPSGGHFVIMSNGSFGGLYQKLQMALAN